MTDQKRETMEKEALEFAIMVNENCSNDRLVEWAKADFKQGWTACLEKSPEVLRLRKIAEACRTAIEDSIHTLENTKCDEPNWAKGSLNLLKGALAELDARGKGKT